MNIIKKLFDEIAGRLVMVLLGLVIILVGLISPARCLYAVHAIGNEERKRNHCSTC